MPPSAESALPRTCVAFADRVLIASGDLAHVSAVAKSLIDEGEGSENTILIFDATSSEPVEIDFRGSLDDVLARLAPVSAGADLDAASQPAPGPDAHRPPGRPRLGVVAREVTLLPRHWEWLAAQPGGASVTLRKLVEQARRDGTGAERLRRTQDAAYRFMSAMAGNEPGFEEAIRALYAGDRARFDAHTAEWPEGIRSHARQLAEKAFSAGEM